jgi:CubicO group peptidase (beta-lactamase class C family)
MNSGTAAKLLLTFLLLVTVVACGPATPPVPTPPPSKAPIDFVALEAEIETTIRTGPAGLDNVRAVLVNVDGETKIAHYRHGFTEDDYLHVWSVTKSVLSILIGIAITDGLIGGVDQPLSELLPDHRQAMSDATAQTTLRQLMTMSGGFDDYWPAGDVWESAPADEAFVDLLLERPQYPPGSAFWYSNPSAHLVAAALAAGLQRATGDRPRTVLDYAREKLFDPLGISTRGAFSGPLPDFFTPEFTKAGFGWGTDPDGIQIGGFGLRLSAPDLMKIGELYRQGGVWNGQQIVPAQWIHESIAPSIRKDDYGLLWWIIDEPEGAGYLASGYGGQQIAVLGQARAVIVYLSATQPAGAMADSDTDPLNSVFKSAFL